MSGPSITYPQGPMVKHGVYHLLSGDMPDVSLQSWNDEIAFYMMGGRSIPDRTRPESVQITGLKGLIAPWETIDQQGATEDGVTFIDALYGPVEVELKAVARGRDYKRTTRVSRHLIESIDVKQKSELGWMTHELGYWWAPVRWFKTAPDAYSGKPTHQEWTLVLRADSGFWQSYPDVDSFQVAHESMDDEFATAHAEDCGPNWPLYYTGDDAGYLHTASNAAVWHDDFSNFTETREVVAGPYKDFETGSDNQVVTMVLGSVPEWSGIAAGYASGANDLWARMGRDVSGDWDGNGIRARITLGAVKLSCFVDFEEVWHRLLLAGTPAHPLPIIPFPNDVWRLIAGYDGDPRLFRITRNGGTALSFKETGEVSQLGADYRGTGFGVRAGGALVTQATPATVRKVAAGDNSSATQSGSLERRNAGDQDAYDEYTLYGPATKFQIANGPGSTEMVEFGPLAAGEVVHIRTDPRKRGVFNPLSVSESNVYLFGTKPSDTLYKKLTGRFFKNQIPAKKPGMRVAPYTIACSITGGNADSRIVASLTPLRRSPQ